MIALIILISFTIGVAFAYKWPLAGSLTAFGSPIIAGLVVEQLLAFGDHSSSTEALDGVFMAIWVACGAWPGMLVAWLVLPARPK